MKSKYLNFDEYEQDLDTEMGFDSTDHFTVYCQKCEKVCIVFEVKTIKKMQVDFEGNKDNCTSIWVACENCKRIGRRKIYWKDHEGRSARYDFNYKKSLKKILRDKQKEND